jgi:pimeloyl-ACP methyl ester carboxylesterase
MATFIFVHGTFAKSAHWPALQEGLAAAAEATGDRMCFQEVRWSGKNRANAREIAAASILSAVETCRSASKDEKLFIIGHSHGGSAIAYFLKNYPTTAKSVTGCAFLSTPFLAIRPRMHALQIFSAVSLPLVLAAAIVWFITSRHWLAPGPFGLEQFFSVWTVYYLGIAVLLGVVGLVTLVLRKANDPQRLVEEAERRQTANIPSGNYLFLRCSGDEAAAALSAMQFMAWLSVKVSHAFELLLRPARRRAVGFIWGLFLVIFPFICLSTGWDIAVQLGISETFQVLAEHITHGRIVVTIGFLLIVFFIIVPFVIIFCTLAAFLILLAQALSLWAFGWTQLSTGFLIDLAIEPLPFGDHSLTHIDWDNRAFRLEGITHSWTYAHPIAIQHLVAWVKTALEFRPLAVYKSSQ